MNILLLLAFLVPAQEDDEGEFKRRAAQFSRLCSKCHTIGQGDRVGPDLKDVSKRRDRNWLIGFIRKPAEYLDSDPFAQEMLQKYGGVRMTDLGLSRADVEGLLSYIEIASEGGGPGGIEAAPIEPRDLVSESSGPDEITGIWWFGVLTLPVFLAGIIGLWLTGWPRAAQVLTVFLVAVAYWSFGGRGFHRAAGDHQRYEPTQPINFSHKVHAGKLGMNCLYCHHAAEKGPIAGVPAVNICMNCHSIVKNRIGEEGVSPEIAKLIEYWDEKDKPNARSIEWVRIHRLPDFVTFNHKAHVQNGVLCQTCHGPIQTMDRVRQVSNLSMGWCVNCHRHRGFDPPTHWQRAEGPLDCAACHQ